MSWTIQIKNALETEGMKTDLIVPLYQFPTFANGERTQLAGWWGDIVAAASVDQPITVVVNPNSGAFDPGSNATAVDYQIYVDAMRLLRANPYVRVLGYLPTGYTTRSLTEVAQQLNWYEQGYKDLHGGSLLDGIFIDEVLGDSASVTYYRSVRDQVRSRQQFANNYLLANPGTVTSSSAFYAEPLADGLIVFENVESSTNPGDTAFAASSLPIGGASGVDYGAIVHTVPTISDLQRVAKLAKGKGYSLLFITNDSLPNPFDNRPAYWSAGLDELHRPVIQNQSTTVAELTPMDTVIGLVSAFDPDPNQSINYSILSGNVNNSFSIDSLGQIRVAAAIDFEITPLYSLVVQVTDSGVPAKSDVATVTIQVTNVNEAPVLTASQTGVTGPVLSALTNSGTWADPENNSVTMVASLGVVQKNANGTWNWSYTPTAAMSGQTVTITATDDGSQSSSVSFLINAQVQVSGRGIYYAGATGSSAQTGLGTDKTALLPGQSSSYSHYSNYSRGLNGVTVDIAGLPSTTTSSQFLGSVLFSSWNGIDASGFTSLPASAIATATMEAGLGVGGSTRVRIRFPDNSLENTWLRVIVQSGSVTGLLTDDVFYFGNVIGELNTGNTSTRLRVNSQDTSLVRNNQSTGTDSASVTNIYDINRDGRVNSQDTSIVRNSQQTSGIVAPITVPPLSPPLSPPGPSNAPGGRNSGGNRSSGGPRLAATSAPTDIKLSASSVREDAVAGTVVGVLTSVDLDPLETHAYELVDGDGSSSNGHFRIVGDSLMTSSTFALDGTSRYTVRIRTTDSESLSFERSLSIDVFNAAPTVSVVNATLAGAEGVRILNSGTYLDVGVDTVVLTASEGTVEKNADGTWNWWLDVADDTLPTRVTITARDDDGGSSSTSFIYSAVNVAPVLTRKYATVNRSPLAMMTNTGTYTDVVADVVTLTASIGTILEVGDGAWTWFLQPTGVINNQTVTITATDKNGGVSNVSFVINAQVSIASRAVVYNNATSSGGSAAPAGDKVALLPGQTATYANYTNYARGLNGLVVDMAGLPESTTPSQVLSSLLFSVWNGISADGFASLPSAAVPSVAIERGAGVGGSARVRISFPDNTIQNTWLRVEVIANANTGLVSNDVFYVGNIIGDLNVGNVT
jgi:hypothetical protein